MKKIIASAMLLAAPIASQAGDWEYSVTPYLWLPTISLDSSDPDSSNSGGLGVGPTDYLQALDFGFMMAGEARKDSFVIKGDYIYLNFGIDDKDVSVKRVKGSADASLIGKVPTLLAGVNVIDSDNYHMDVLAGWRRADLDASLDMTRNNVFPNIGPVPAGTRLFDMDITYDDFLVAINGEYDLADSNWSFPYYADVGAGDSDLTWQMMVGADYSFGSWKLHMNYRHLVYDFGDVPATVALIGSVEARDVEVIFSGPSIGAKFEF
jgi:hypothetical protein